MQFEEWNTRLIDHFFNEGRAERRVHLHITKAELDKLDQTGYDGFRKAMMAGPRGFQSHGHCIRALKLRETWNHEGVPPFFAYLVAFVAAWTSEDDPEFAKHNYHDRLRAFFMEARGTGSLPSFERTDILWRDLEEWANHIKERQLGRFRAESIGGHVHIGYPLAQAYFSHAQLADLHRAFRQAALSPEDSYSDAFLQRFLAENARSCLSSAQLEALLQQNHARLNDLLTAVRNELEELADAEEADVPRATALTMLWQPRIGALEGRLHLRGRQLLPELGVDVSHSDGRQGYFEPMLSWLSAPLKDSKTCLPAPIEPAEWTNGTTWNIDNGTTIKLAATTVRIFVADSRLPDGMLLERKTMPGKGSFYIIGLPDEVSTFENDHACSFAPQPVSIRSGCPPGWVIASCSGAATSGGEYAPSDQLRLRLRGGIRASTGHHFFAFAPPTVEIEASKPTTFTLNGEPRDESAAILPTEPGRYEIVVAAAGCNPRRMAVTLTEAQPTQTRFEPELAKAPRHAHRCIEDHELICALGRSDVLVGQYIGQVDTVRLHDGSWDPVWCISPGRRPTVARVMDADAEISPRSGTGYTPRDRKRWKRYTWHIRRRARLHEAVINQGTWRQYVEAGRNA